MSTIEWSSNTEKVLEVSNLVTRFHTQDGTVHAVNGVSFFVGEGEMLGERVIATSRPYPRTLTAFAETDLTGAPHEMLHAPPCSLMSTALDALRWCVGRLMRPLT